LKPFIPILALFLLPLCGLTQDKDSPTSEEGGAKNPFPLQKYYAEKAPPGKIRKMLSRFHFGLTTGYGITSFQHFLNGYSVNQGAGNPSISDGNSAYGNWISNAAPTNADANFKVPSDTDKLGFRSKTGAMPAGFTLDFNFKYFRIGGGYSFEFLSIGDFEPLTYGGKIQPYKLGQPSALLRKFYGKASVPFYTNDRLILLADLQVGSFKFKSNFNTDLIKPQLFYNLGVKVEYGLSEFLQVYVRPSYEIKSYEIAVGGGSIKHSMNTAFLTVGFTYSIPELPRCFIENCHAQVNHSHGNKSYRSRIHPIYRKQNPGTGENYPNSLPKK